MWRVEGPMRTRWFIKAWWWLVALPLL